MPARLLVAPSAFARSGLRAVEVAAAVGRGIERAGLEPPDLCPVADGGPGTAEVLLLGLGGQTAGHVALLEDGGTAVVEQAAHVADAVATGAEVVVLAAGDAEVPDGLDAHPARLVVLRGRRGPDVWGSAFVLEALDVDERMRAAGAVIVGAGTLDAGTLLGPAAGEIAVRARQAGVPCHAVCARNRLTLFDQRILDLQHVVEAPSLAALEAAGERLAANL